ncbi:aldehyde dehydrogenase [Chromobacterium haemolyticum]|uniref:aldehyde dehydrogenase n=1 Tax=Chromobacterium haemolyticum TaxID=394935 RepID=UPI000DEF3320|nr:aldehyde dehydrogenase [Chromobacterium haemolyticum]
MSAEPLLADDWRALAKALPLEQGLFIDGDFRQARSGRRFASVNPSNDETLAELPSADGQDVDIAVNSARRAFQSGVWSRRPPRERMAVLNRLADLIEQHQRTFALLDCLDMGKPISEMLTVDLPLSVQCLRFTAESIDKVLGTVGATASHIHSFVLRQPLGVVACVVPWNYPLLMSCWKIAPALAAGNSVVLKPAEESPLSALWLAKLFIEAGAPPGVLNVLTGDGPGCGRPLALHQDVDKIAFTGSAEVGKLMLCYAGQSNMKQLSLECGGKSPHVILADVRDLEAAARWAAMGVFGNQGQICCAGSRLLVEQSILPDFLEAFLNAARAHHIPGDPLDPATSMGPLVGRGQQRRVLDYIALGRQAGAQCLLGGDTPRHLEHGAYVNPTVFAGVNNGMRIAREEIFGPVACVMPVSGLDQAIAIANDSPFGLAAGIWTQNLNHAHRFAREVEAGMVYVNSYMDGDMQLPFGGWKESGNGRDKCFDALLAYTQTKGVWMTLNQEQ